MNADPPNVAQQLVDAEAAATPNQQLATGPGSLASQEYERLAADAAAEQQHQQQLEQQRAIQREADRREYVWPAFAAYHVQKRGEPPAQWLTLAPEVTRDMMSVAGGAYMFIVSRDRPFIEQVGRTVLGAFVGGVSGQILGTVVHRVGVSARSIRVSGYMPVDIERYLVAHVNGLDGDLPRLQAMREDWAELAAVANGEPRPGAQPQQQQQMAVSPWLPVAASVAGALIKR